MRKSGGGSPWDSPSTELLEQLLLVWPRQDAHDLLAQHVGAATPAFKERLKEKAKAKLDGPSRCPATIMLAYVAPTETSCQQVDRACAEIRYRRVKGSCTPPPDAQVEGG